MKFSFSSEVSFKLKRIKKRDPKLFIKIQKQLNFFLQDYKHPSLRNHKLKSGSSECWSISIGGNLRMLYYMRNTKAIFFDMGTHDEVYRK